MKIFTLAVALSAATLCALAAAPAHAQTTCQTLATDYERASMNLADNFAAGLADNSAPRATLRATEDNNTLLEAQMTLHLMEANKCKMPDRAPTASKYAVQALECRTARLKGDENPPQCKRETWQPSAPEA